MSCFSWDFQAACVLSLMLCYVLCSLLFWVGPRPQPKPASPGWSLVRSPSWWQFLLPVCLYVLGPVITLRIHSVFKRISFVMKPRGRPWPWSEAVWFHIWFLPGSACASTLSPQPVNQRHCMTKPVKMWSEIKTCCHPVLKRQSI